MSASASSSPSSSTGPRVLHILHALQFSGAEVMLRLAAPTLRRWGYTQHLLTDGSTPGDYAATLAAHGFVVHHLPHRPFSLPHLWRVFRFLRRHRFEVVHNHTEQSFFWYLLVAWLAGTPQLVSTVHSAYTFQGQARLRRGFYRWVCRRLLGVRFAAISESVAAVEQHTFRNPTTLVPNWVDEMHFVPARSPAERTVARQQFGLPPGAVVLLSVGSCTHNKNHTAILAALPALLAEAAQPVVYLHVGNGHTCVQEQEQACQLGLGPDTVQFVGQLGDVRPALLAADIFVMPSMLEGLGNALLEALSCGVPAVVYDVYGLRDLVRDQLNGRCVAPTVPALTTGLAELIADAPLRAQYGTAARRFVEQHYSMSDSLRRLRALYEAPAPNDVAAPAGTPWVATTT